MNFPLADLVKNLKEFPIMRKFFNPEEVEILGRKGVFPYECFDSFDKLYETEFPPHEAFRSKLSGWDEKAKEYKNIKKEDYDFGQSVYKRFCKIFMDYHEKPTYFCLLMFVVIFQYLARKFWIRPV